MTDPDDTTPVRTTATSLEIVEVLVDLGEARIEDIAESLEIAPSTAHRHLQTLKTYGYVVNEKGTYKPGLQFLTVGGKLRASKPAFDLVKDSVYDLAKQTKERVQFEVEEQGERVFLFTDTGEHAVKADAKIGRRGPLHCSAAGKALLAEFPDSQVRYIIDQKGLPEITENTITETDELLEELKTIRQKGIAFNREESTAGLHAVASSVKGPNGELLGALSVSGPARRLSGQRFNTEIPDLVRGAAQELELNIEYL
jgi:DNA-binding IclR family transcriptional regulator